MKKIFSDTVTVLILLTILFDLSVLGYIGYVFYTIKTGANVLPMAGEPLSLSLIVINSVIFVISLINFILKKFR